MKTCSCGTTGEENFYRNKSTKDGLCFYCKTCIAKQRREEWRRKYPNGKNGGYRTALMGNQRALKHGRYVGTKRKQKSKPEVTAIDTLLRSAW